MNPASSSSSSNPPTGLSRAFGCTILVIEHNLDVIKTADYIIDLGPEGGDEGGRVIATGTPEEVAACRKSYTGKFLKPLLNNLL